MKRHGIILWIFLLIAMPCIAQQYIGCRIGDNWAETPMLRKTFKLSKTEYSTGNFYIEVRSLGYHEVYLNGMKVGNEVLQPAVSQLDKRPLAVTYDLLCRKSRRDYDWR